MKELERYLQFAIDNGYKKLDEFKNLPMEVCEFDGEYTLDIDDDGCMVERRYCFLSIITSKPFVDAVISGINAKGVTNINPVYGITLNNFLLGQALAIYNGTLEEFINNLLPKIEQGEK